MKIWDSVYIYFFLSWQVATFWSTTAKPELSSESWRTWTRSIRPPSPSTSTPCSTLLGQVTLFFVLTCLWYVHFLPFKHVTNRWIWLGRVGNRYSLERGYLPFRRGYSGSVCSLPGERAYCGNVTNIEVVSTLCFSRPTWFPQWY